MNIIILNIPMDKNFDIDNTDIKILNQLLHEANRPYTLVAKEVGVSDGTIHLRMRKLKEMGVIKGAELRLDYSRMGWDIAAFLGIYLDKSSLYEEVADELSQVPEITSLHYTTGIYSMFAHLVCRDTRHLREVLHDKIQKIRGIQRTETIISLEESFNRPVEIIA